MAWERPNDGSKYPRMWIEFTAPGDAETTYEIRDLPASQFDQATELMINCFLNEAPVARAMRAIDEPASIEDFIERWRVSVAQRMALGCYVRGCDKVIGVSLLGVIGRNDPPAVVTPRGDAYRKAYHIYCDVDKKMDVFTRYDVDYCLKSYGVTVSRNFRYRGIATQLLKARLPMMREFKIPITYSLFTATSSQRAATKAGYKSFDEVE